MNSGFNKKSYDLQQQFVERLKDKTTLQNIARNEELRPLTANDGERYGLYLVKLNNNTIPERLYVTLRFKNNVNAINGFRKQVRENMLKDYSVVHCVVKKIFTDENGMEHYDIIGKFFEDRTGHNQRTIQFLQRHLFTKKS